MVFGMSISISQMSSHNTTHHHFPKMVSNDCTSSCIEKNCAVHNKTASRHELKIRGVIAKEKSDGDDY